MIDALAATSFDDGFNKPAENPADKPAFVAARKLFAGNKQVGGKKRPDGDGPVSATEVAGRGNGRLRVGDDTRSKRLSQECAIVLGHLTEQASKLVNRHQMERDLIVDPRQGYHQGYFQYRGSYSNLLDN